MAIITEEPDSPQQLRHRKPSPKATSNVDSPPPPTTATAAAVNPFPFWFYFTLFVSLLTLICVLISSLSPQDPKTWFLNLPLNLRRHYSNGRTLKVQTAINHPQVEVFSIQQGPINADSRVLIVHGVGCSSFAFQDVVKSLGFRGVRTVAIDLPGSGFSDKSVVVMEEYVGGGGPFSKMWDVYEEIQEKGLFWGFDQLVEQGYVDREEIKVKVSMKERVRPIELGSEEMERVLGQVVDSMELAPVDLVLHDSALGLSANWISKNRDLIRSVVILDGAPTGVALPLWVLEVPVVKEIVLGFGFVFEMVLGRCCMKSVGRTEAEAHRILLKGRDGASAVVGMAKKLNTSFDLFEWSSRDSVKSLPFQLIWSDDWTSEGQKTADALFQAKFVNHSGGRWMQETNSEEVADSIYEFISSLPKSSREVVEEAKPNHSKESNDNRHQHGADDKHHGHGHDHDHHGHGGYMDSAYGMGHGHGWGM